MKKILLFLLVAEIFIAGCTAHQSLKEKQAQVETGKIDENLKYNCSEIGWETYLPKEWELLTNAETKSMNEKGKDALEKSTGTSLDMSGLKELVNLKKDVYNSFLSTIEKYDVSEMGAYAARSLEVDKLVADTYTAKKIKFETKAGSEKIDNVDFHTLEIKIYMPQSDKILLTQKMYSALLKGYDFGMTINYNNETDKQTLLKIVTASKFL